MCHSPSDHIVSNLAVLMQCTEICRFGTSKTLLFEDLFAGCSIGSFRQIAVCEPN